MTDTDTETTSGTGAAEAGQPEQPETGAPDADTITLYLDGRPYTVPADPERLPVSHLIAVERHTGMTVGEWGEKLDDSKVSLMAVTALAWVAKRIAGEFVKWDEFAESLSCGELLRAMNSGPAGPAVPVPNRAERRAAERSGDPRRRAQS